MLSRPRSAEPSAEALASQRARLEGQLELVADELRGRVEQDLELRAAVREVVVPRTGYPRAHSFTSRADQPGRGVSLWDIELHSRPPLLRDSAPLLVAHARRLRQLVVG